MRKILLALAAFLFALPAYGQSTLYTSSSGIGIGTSSPTTGTALDIGSNTNSILLPIGTTGQRPTGVAGMVRYNSTNSVPEFYTSSWLPVPLTASSPISINSTTGNITCSTCNTSAANVNSVSGDGAFYTNSASTGAVTLTLGNASAYSIWGNNTSSSATPAYTASPELSGTITDIQSIGSTSTDGLVLTDTTAATSSNQKWSPRVRWTGQGWKTNTTAGSQEVDAIAEIQPVQGTANPTFNWVLSGQVNNGGYGPLLTVPSGGGLNLNSGVYEINGTQLAASNLLNGVTGSGSIVLAVSPSLTTPNIGAATGTSLAVTGNITTLGGQVGVGTASPTTGAALDLGSNTTSMLLPAGNTAQRPSGVSGMIRYNSDTPGLEAFYNSVWNSLLNTKALMGTTTNDNAVPGAIGEYISSNCPGSAYYGTVTVTIASPAVVTLTGHGLTSGDGTNDGGICPVVFATTGSLPTGITAGTVYYTIGSSLTANTFEIADSIADAIAGNAINTSGSQSGTQTGFAGVPMTSVTDENCTAISLTPGDWDVSGSIYPVPTSGSTVVTVVSGELSTASGTSASPQNGTNSAWNGSSQGSAPTLQIAPFRMSVNAATTVYLLAYADFTYTMYSHCFIRARRMR